MTHSMNTHVHSSSAMRAAGFRYTHRDDIMRCDICTLEVSRWTQDMDPFTIHSDQSPHCAFVRSIQSSNNFQVFSYSRSSSPNDFISERTSDNEQNPAKRQRTGSSFSEVDGLQQARQHSFSLWPHSPPFRARMIEAGFFSCNVNDRVICIYCDLICHEWNIERDDPYEVHKTLSPNCILVKSMTIRCSSIVPSHIDYADPQKRYASFSTWPDAKLASIKKLVDGGFFYANSKITCFYCNGSFEDWESDSHPIAEHVRWFPHCNHAKELCGEELYNKIQQSMRYVSSSRNGEFTDNHCHHGLIIPDEETLLHLVADRLDLPISQRLLQSKTFEYSTIKQCWENQLRLKRDDFISDCDLVSACTVHKKQIELIDKKKKRIVVPSRDLQTNGGSPSPSLTLDESNQSYTNILVSFENDLQKYENTRQTMAAEFKEEKQITKDRERSLKKWSYTKPSRLDLVKGGWVISDTGDYWKCPHCHMTYHSWRSNDDPFLIHRYLSPHCLFVLSPNPFHQNEIPIRPVSEHFTDDDIARSGSQPYNGLVQSRFSAIYSVSDRLISFDRFPGGCPVNANELAIAGFFYINHGRFIRCYYCRRTTPVRNHSSQSDKYLKDYHLSGQCFYTQQLNDCDPNRSVEEASDKCVWCMKENKRLLALPCRHFCLCEKCGQINRTCPKCSNDVTAYAILYPA